MRGIVTPRLTRCRTRHSARPTRHAASSTPRHKPANVPAFTNSIRGGRHTLQLDKCSQCRAEEADASSFRQDGTPDEASAFIRQLRDLPWNRVAIWSMVALAATQLSDFFGIGMGVFMLTFIGRSMTDYVQGTNLLDSVLPQGNPQRKVLVLVYFVTIASIISVFGVLTIPYMVREGADFIVRLQSENIWVVVLEKMRMGLGDDVMMQLEKFLLLVSQENVMKVQLPLDVASGEAVPAPWTNERLATLGAAVQSMLQGYTEKAIQVTSGLLSWVTHFTVQVSISLILSFMFLWDWPNIANGIGTMNDSRLKGIYQEVAPSVLVFSQLFGKALQAQTQIAVCNTVLTWVGMYLLGIPGILLLSLFVFLCSFIPVAGCIISTVPIGFVALTEYGFARLALSIVMVFLVHAVEAYILNPAIYSAHLRLHPLLVLSVLVIAEHSLGVWGLLLAVPLTVFTLDYCIRYPQLNAHGVAEKELENVTGVSVDEISSFYLMPGFTPEDMAMDATDYQMSPDAQRLITRNPSESSMVPDDTDDH